MPEHKKLKTGPFLLIALLVGVAFAIHYFLVNFPNFRIRTVSIFDAQGRPLANPQNFFHLEGDGNLFKLDVKRIAQDIRARHPELASVFIRKQFPNRLLIVTVERKPVAIVLARDFYLVDAQGFILPYQSKHSELAKIVGMPAQHIQLYTQSESLILRKALSFLKELEKAKVYPHYKITQLNVKEYPDITFYLEGGTEVKMGKEDFAQKAHLLRGVLNDLSRERTKAKYIDMRFGNPVVKP